METPWHEVKNTDGWMTRYIQGVEGNSKLRRFKVGQHVIFAVPKRVLTVRPPGGLADLYKGKYDSKLLPQSERPRLPAVIVSHDRAEKGFRNHDGTMSIEFRDSFYTISVSKPGRPNDKQIRRRIRAYDMHEMTDVDIQNGYQAMGAQFDGARNSEQCDLAQDEFAAWWDGIEEAFCQQYGITREKLDEVLMRRDCDIMPPNLS